MRKIILLTLINLIPFFCISQENLKYAKDNLDEILSTNIKKEEVNIYVTDIITLDTIINKSKSENKIIYSFSNTCHFSFSAFPELIDYVNSNKEKFKLLIVISSRFEEVDAIKKYFQKLKYFDPIYILDTKLYGNQKNPSRRNELMISKLCSKCNSNKMGFSDLFIKGDKNKIIYHSNYNIPWKNIFLEIMKI